MYSIDVVITWVDGQDPLHIKKRNARLLEIDEQCSQGTELTRFNECGELSVCVRSWFCHAPWIRNIYIVTDAQMPQIIQELQSTEYASRIQVIDHKILFQNHEDLLPTFNSLSIESMLWRIPELSENFIYCNDDCFVLRKVLPTDFFQKDRIVVRGEWKVQQAYKWRYRLKRWLGLQETEMPMHRRIQENSARLVGLKKYFLHLPHAPFALKKSIIADYFQKNSEVWLKNAAYAFRDPVQFWPIAWLQQTMLDNGQAVLDNRLKAIMINAACHTERRIYNRLAQASRDLRVAFVCMQSLDQAPLSLQQKLLKLDLGSHF